METGKPPPISQKEYLKKYLSKDKGEKKKKKKVKITSSAHIKRSVIIDDDLGLPSMASIEDEEFNLEYLGDEAPQVAGVIDERPPEVIAKETHGDPAKWKPFGESEVDETTEESVIQSDSFIKKLVGKIVSKTEFKENKKQPKDRASSSDKSPPRSRTTEKLKQRKPVNNSDSDVPVVRAKDKLKHRDDGSDSDLSPPRINKNSKRSQKDNDSYKNTDRQNKAIHDKHRSRNDSGDSDASSPRKKEKNVHIKNDSDSDLSPPRKNKSYERTERGSNSSRNTDKYNKIINDKRRSRNDSGDSESSPPRRKDKNFPVKNESDSDLSPPRKGQENAILKKRQSKRGSDSDASPPRKNDKNTTKGHQNINRKKYGSDSDPSPPRKNDHRHKKEIQNHSSRVNTNYGSYKNRGKDSDSDLSPPRKKDNRNRDDRSELRKRKESDSDASPPRKKDKNAYKNDLKTSRKKYDSDSDLSPPRKNDRNNKNDVRNTSSRHDRSISNKYGSNNKSRGEDKESPPRKRMDEDLSKARKVGREDLYPRSEKEGRRGDRGSDPDLSLPRRSGGTERRGLEEEEQATKLDKTLDGKKAGLQSARGLKDELKRLRAEEDAVFSKMKASVSGQNAGVVMRDRKTGRIRDLEKEKEEQREKSAKASEREKKYAKWGKGLKQIEEAEERVASALREMAKPLARYAGDQDLEDLLKAREREGDPMLDYIRTHQADSINVDVIGKPKYQGHFMPNRFGIRPGHRWDGVDRSNGYERQWFEKQNARKAVQEEAYKWSTSDM